MTTNVGIVTLMSKINFMQSCVEHEKSFITLEKKLNYCQIHTVEVVDIDSNTDTLSEESEDFGSVF